MPRALIVKLGAIGDVVMVIPAAHALHQSGYEIDWLCGEVVAPVLRLYPWVHVIAVDERRLLSMGKVEAVRLLAEVWRKLAGRGYELCATLYYDRRYRLLTLPVRTGRRIRLSNTDRATRLLPGRHHSDEYIRILLERKDQETQTRVSPVRPKGLPSCSLPRQAAKPRVVLVPAGARNLLRNDALRRWPVNSYADVAARLLAAGCEVVLAGGPDDVWVSPAFASLRVTDLIGKLSLVETLALLDSAEVTVTHDTGPLHLAGLTSTATVAIFGPTDPHWFFPAVANAVALWGGEGFACRPCYNGHDYAPCPHNGCMEQVTPDMVMAEVMRMLQCVKEGREELPRVITPPHTPLVQLGPQRPQTPPEAR